MGAKLDIEEASQRLKNSNEQTGSNKTKLKKLKNKIDAAFEIKKPACEETKEESKVEENLSEIEDLEQIESSIMENPQDFLPDF